MLHALLTILTLLAFASNSLLCRMALGAHLIDPVSFSTLRLLSGAVVLYPLSLPFKKSAETNTSEGSWGSGLALFAYAFAFSLAYTTLDAGIGALILFTWVQGTMIALGIRSGERPRLAQWLGLALALIGLVYLVSPGMSSPHPVGVILMSVAGIAWGLYSLRGRRSRLPVLSTSGNFTRTVPLAVAASLLAVSSLHLKPRGILLAVVSGAVTSGIGYVLWYRTLRGLTATQAAIVQLMVPVLAAFGGVAFLSERLSLRLVVSAVLIIFGVGMAAIFKADNPPSHGGPARRNRVQREAERTPKKSRPTR